MIKKEISKQVITLGCDYETLKGGIAQVIESYSRIFETFYFIPTVKEGGKLYKFWVMLVAIIRLCYYSIWRNIKIVHIHACSNNSFRRKRIFVFIAKCLGKKVVFHIHGAEFKSFCECYGKQRVIRVLKRCDAVIALSHSWQDYFRNELGLSNVVIINNIVNLPVVVDGLKNENMFNMVFLGEIGKRKGIYDLIYLLLDDKENYEGRLRLHVGGNGETKKFERLIEPIDSIVKFYGWVDVDRKQYLLSQANAYILPSYNEGLPISILEAMSYGLPIISTNVGGIPEIVEDSYNGFLISPGDKEAMKKAIDKLLCNPELREEMGEHSKQLVEKFFPQEVEKQLLDLYESLL